MPDNSTLDTLKSLLGDNADQKIQNVLNTLSNATTQENNDLPAVQNSPVNLSSNSSDTKSLESILKIKGIIDELSSKNNDYRSNLLLSLKPFMRGTRQHSIDSAIKLLNLTRLTSLFKL